jgi:prolyl-tRNA synthetase
MFQIQTKFRDEPRAKSGLLRTREFSMKDLYSFHIDQSDLDKYYEKAIKAYFNVFKRCGLGKTTVLTYASGGDFSKYSHEFQTICETGEDTIYLCEKCNVAVNKEIIHEQSNCPECGNKKLVEKKAIEVGNIFKLGTRFSEAWDLKYQDKDGKENLVIMASYGIGPGRVMGAVAEIYNDKNGLIWPKEIAPYDIHLVSLNKEKEAEEIYKKLLHLGRSVLWDDRDERAGVKLADADLLGIPTRVIVSEKTLKEKKVEVKDRGKKKSELISISALLKRK